MIKDRNVNCTLEEDLQSEISRLKVELIDCQRSKECLEKQLERAKEDRDAYRLQAQSASRHALEVMGRIAELNEIIDSILRAEGDDLDIYLRDLKEWYGARKAVEG